MQEVLSVPDVVAALKPGYCHARNAAARAAGAAGPSFCTQYAGTPHEGLGHFAMPGADFSELFETAAVGVEDLTAGVCRPLQRPGVGPPPSPVARRRGEGGGPQ